MNLTVISSILCTCVKVRINGKPAKFYDYNTVSILFYHFNISKFCCMYIYKKYRVDLHYFTRRSNRTLQAYLQITVSYSTKLKIWLRFPSRFLYIIYISSHLQEFSLRTSKTRFDVTARNTVSIHIHNIHNSNTIFF